MGDRQVSEQQMFKRFKQILLIFALMILVVGSALMVVKQIFKYYHDYREYNQLLTERNALRIERGQLLLEQQVFGTTIQVSTRAVTQLKMFSPPATEVVIVDKNR